MRPVTVEGTDGGRNAPHAFSSIDESDALERELSRCQNQLDLVFDITSRIAHLQEPDLIQATLLRRLSGILHASAVYLDRGGACMRIDPDADRASHPALRPELVRSVLGTCVETVRRRRRVRVPSLTADEAGRLEGSHALLGALPRPDGETGVIVVLRGAADPPFGRRDVVACESVLTYGAQVLGNVLMVQHLRRTAIETVCTLVNAIDAKDNYTSVHSERVGSFARMVGEAMGLSRDVLQDLEWAGQLHDVGKIGVPERILNKPGALSDAELEQMQRHPVIGYEVLKPVGQFENVLEAVLHHHENHDGSGYPAGLAGEQIPLIARIIHVVDIFDALTTNRPYRQSYSTDQALRILIAGAGRVTDPAITEIFTKTLERYQSEKPDAYRTLFGHLLANAAC